MTKKDFTELLRIKTQDIAPVDEALDWTPKSPDADTHIADGSTVGATEIYEAENNLPEWMQRLRNATKVMPTYNPDLEKNDAPVEDEPETWGDLSKNMAKSKWLSELQQQTADLANEEYDIRKQMQDLKNTVKNTETTDFNTAKQMNSLKQQLIGVQQKFRELAAEEHKRNDELAYMKARELGLVKNADEFEDNRDIILSRLQMNQNGIR